MVVVNAADGEDPEPRGVMADVFERLGESVERILDKVFDKPYVVPDADAARRLMLDQDARRPSAISQFVQNQAVVRLTGWIAKSSRFSGTGATTAVTALLGSGQRARRQFRSDVSKSARTRSTSASGRAFSGGGWFGGKTPRSSDRGRRAMRKGGPGPMAVT